MLEKRADLADKQAPPNEIIAALNADIVSHQRTQPAVALEAIFARDELREAAGLPPPPTKSPPRKSGRRTASSSARCWNRFPPRNIIARWNRSRRRIPTAGWKCCAAR
jgi:hypothetical protein